MILRVFLIAVGASMAAPLALLLTRGVLTLAAEPACPRGDSPPSESITRLGDVYRKEPFYVLVTGAVKKDPLWLAATADSLSSSDWRFM